MTLSIGLTGGIASGKSTVSRLFSQLGAPVIDADKISHELMMPGMVVYHQIVDLYGESILDAQRHIDREQLGALVFSNPSRRRQLEALIHPRVLKIMMRKFTEQTADYCILDVPLLIETGMDQQMDRVAVVDVNPDIQRTRLARRNGFDTERIDQILASQTTREVRILKADDLIDNNGSIETLERRIVELDTFYRLLQQEHDD